MQIVPKAVLVSLLTMIVEIEMEFNDFIYLTAVNSNILQWNKENRTSGMVHITFNYKCNFSKPESKCFLSNKRKFDTGFWHVNSKNDSEEMYSFIR